MQAAYLPGGRLHLHHGPIDLIIGAEGPGREAAFAAAAERFETILAELVEELPALRAPAGPPLTGAVAQTMRAAALPFAAEFITPMAAVAGAVADEILRVMTAEDLHSAYVNNGGDVALHLASGAEFTAAAGPDRIRLTHDGPARGVATSGWRGRSQSLGIADSVTVLARTAAGADAAATMIANAVDLPGHPAITRAPARDVYEDSDLGDRLVTTAVGPLTEAEIAAALDAGAARANDYLTCKLIEAALLSLAGERRAVGPPNLIAPAKETQHA